MAPYTETDSGSTRSPEDIAFRGHRPEAFTGQKGAILSALLQHRGDWIPAYTLGRIALHYNARVREPRDTDYVIGDQAARQDRQGHGSFRLVALPGDSGEVGGGQREEPTRGEQ